MTKLIGTAPNQVPTNADLGSLAYVDHDNVNLTASDLKLKALSKTKDATAVDVFVYDTSQDTDGGAWRHRTQHTSWYNEGASSTRGSRKEFPAVAVIVAEASKVTIYDGDDPSLPMWMVFNATNKGIWITGLTGVAAINGAISVSGAGPSYFGWSDVNFISEIFRFATNSAQRVLLNSVAERNDAASIGTVDTSKALVNSIGNDVAMTVLPNAPIDPATGLPVPTIAVATDGGVSVIKDDGTVVDSADTYAVKSVNFDANNFIWYPRDGGSTQRYSQTYAADGFQGRNWQLGFPTAFASLSSITLTDSTKDTVVLGAANTSQGISQLHVDASSESNSMVAYTTSSYTTGWMNGDIKLAALADTTAETLSGSELLSAFSDASWTTTTGEWTYDAANDEWDLALSTAGSTSSLSHDISTTEGSVYVATATVSNVTNVTGNELFIRINNTETGTVELIKDDGSGDAVAQGGDGTYTATFVAGASTPNFQIRAAGASDGDETATLVSASVRLADPDRSVNGNGLGVHGSITKAAVATGADVVAYSGFSSSNYLEQPYNSDLDFGAYTGTAGTGDFCVMGWVKGASSMSTATIVSRCSSASDGFHLFKQTTSISPYARLRIGSTYLNGTTGITDQWNHLVGVRKDGVAYIYKNGVLENSASISTDVSGSFATEIGWSTADTLITGLAGISLLRISATAPTANQIRKIYEDEKVLFQENAKATLTGSSDAVTSLAHDPDTELLHVGTSGGRSVFQGLRRVEEHTGTDNQSLAAISAVDGLVVEGK